MAVGRRASGGPIGYGVVEKFGAEYQRICEELEVPLAELSPEKDKSFEPSTEGVVMGIQFNSITRTWQLPEEKAELIENIIEDFPGYKNMQIEGSAGFERSVKQSGYDV